VAAVTTVFIFASAGETQTPIELDPARDLAISFSSKHEGTDPGSVFGKVTNNSANPYPCIRIEFDLSTRFDMRGPKEPSKKLGVLTTEVRDIQPRSVSDYRAQLPYPAGVGLRSFTVCSGVSKQSPGKGFEYNPHKK
jgi:hypothetical protein